MSIENSEYTLTSQGKQKVDHASSLEKAPGKRTYEIIVNEADSRFGFFVFDTTYTIQKAKDGKPSGVSDGGLYITISEHQNASERQNVSKHESISEHPLIIPIRGNKFFEKLPSDLKDGDKILFREHPESKKHPESLKSGIPEKLEKIAGLIRKFVNHELGLPPN